MFSEDFEDESVGDGPAALVPDGNANPDWDNSYFETGTGGKTLEITSANLGSNASNKLKFDTDIGGEYLLLGANFDPSTKRYVTIEYDIRLTAHPPVHPSGEIIYTDGYEDLDGSGSTRIAVHLLFGDEDNIDGDQGDDVVLHRDIEDGDLTTLDDGTESETKILTGFTWSTDTWYRVQLTADQENHSYDLKVTNKTDGTQYSQQGIVYNAPPNTGPAGYIRKVWFGISASAPTVYLDHVDVYQGSAAPSVNAPSVLIQSEQTGSVSANPPLDPDFADGTDLYSLSYQIDGNDPAGTWSGLTTDGVTAIDLTTSAETFYGNPVQITDTDFAALADGTHTIYFRARDDDSGNDAYDSGTDHESISVSGVEMTKDTTPPETPSVKRPSGGTIGSNITSVSGEFRDLTSGIAAGSADIQILDLTNNQYWDGSAWQNGTGWISNFSHSGSTDDSSVSWSYTPAAAVDLSGKDGINLRIKVRVDDNVGLASAEAAQDYTVDLGAPEITINSYTVGPSNSNEPFDVDFSDNTDIEAAEYQIDGTGGTWHDIQASDSDSDSVDFSGTETSYTAPFYMRTSDFDGMSEGTHQIYFRVSDGTNTTVSSIYVDYKKDTTAPDTASVLKPASDPFGELSTISGELADAAGGYGLPADSAVFRIERLSDNFWWNGSTASWQSGSYNNVATHSGTADGATVEWVKDESIPGSGQLTSGVDYTFEVEIIDRAGNTRVGSVTRTYDPDAYTWTGEVNVDWDEPGNWERSEVPPDDGTAKVTVPGSLARYPVLSTSIDVETLVLESGATVSAAGNDVTVRSTFTSDGTLRLQGNEATVSLPVVPVPGTVEYYGTGAGVIHTALPAGSSYTHLRFDDPTATPDTWELSALLTVNGDLALAGGTLDVSTSNYQINVAGDWSNSGGGFNEQAGRVVFDGGATQNVTAETFYHLKKQGGSRLKVLGNLTVSGTLQIASNSEAALGNNNFTISTLDNAGVFELDGTQGTHTISTFASRGTFRYVHGASAGKLFFTTFDRLVLADDGGGTSRSFDTSGVTGVNGSLIVTDGTLRMQHDVSVGGPDLTIDSDADGDGGITDAATVTLTFSGAAWTNHNGAGGFTPGTGTVIFDAPASGADPDVTITGNNSFYVFETTTSADPGRTLHFGAGDTQRILTGGTFRVHGTDDGDGSPDTRWAELHSINDASGSEWELLVESGASVDMQYTEVHYSRAVEPLVIPYTTVVHNCIDWLAVMVITGSTTLDTDGDGKIDAIRVELPVAINDDFSDTEIAVDGYTVRGYDTGAAANDEFFMIRLEEAARPDSGAAPSWYIPEGTTDRLRDEAYNRANIVVDPNTPETKTSPDDLAGPVIAHTLAYPGKREIFVRFSEAVESNGGGVVSAADFTYNGSGTVNGLTRLSTAGDGTETLLLQLDSGVSAAEILNETTIEADVQDRASSPNLINGASHRVADLGLGIIQPVYALNPEVRRSQGADTGRVSDFTGSGWLLPQKIRIEANTNGLGGDPELYFASDVPEAYISETNPGLWLPMFSESSFSGLVPFPYTRVDDGSALSAGPESSSTLAVHTIPSGSWALASDVRFDFFYEYPLGSHLYHGRCSDPAASDWYRRVRPWSFELQAIRQQALRVSMLNNVIQPGSGTAAELHYELQQEGSITIRVFTLSGELVETLYRGQRSPGEYVTRWDGRNQAGNPVARGIYFVRFTGPGNVDEFRKVLVIK